MKKICLFIYLVSFSVDLLSQSKLTVSGSIGPRGNFNLNYFKENLDTERLNLLLFCKESYKELYKKEILNLANSTFLNWNILIVPFKTEKSIGDLPYFEGNILDFTTFVFYQNGFLFDDELFKAKKVDSFFERLNSKDNNIFKFLFEEVCSSKDPILMEEFKLQVLSPRINEIVEFFKGPSPASSKDDYTKLLNEFNSGFSGIRKDLKDVKDQIKALDDKLKESEDDKFSKIRFEPSFRFANNFSEMSYHLFYHDDVKRSHYFVFGISAGELQGNTSLDNYEYRDGFSTYSISGIQESSLTKFNGLSVGYKHIKDFDGGPLEIHTRIGMQLNRIFSSNYSWSSGEMDVRGKLDGIGDEIINVPELGFQENQILLGVSGENQIKRFFGSVDLDLSLHYNLEKIDFFLGCGGIASTKIQPMKSDALIFNGRQFNGLMSTVQPMSLINAYITLGASIIF